MAQSEDDFTWTFPLFVLAGNYKSKPEGSSLFEADTFFIAPRMPTELHLAVFTDSDLAKSFQEHCGHQLNLRVFSFGPDDPHPGGRRSRTAQLSDLIDAIEWHIKTHGKS
jgi:hypothetical protein